MRVCGADEGFVAIVSRSFFEEEPRLAKILADFFSSTLISSRRAFLKQEKE
jgi:hypothetical protein